MAVVIPRLSICIATLNRAKFIVATLQSLLAQLPDTAEIVVLDGGSTDGTERIMRQFESDVPNLRYLRQDINHGVDRDYNSAVEACQGEYVWLMTDDDVVKLGAIGSILAALRDQPSLVIINAEVRNADLSQLLQSRRLPVEMNRVFSPEDWDELLAETGSYLSFIGCVVIRRSIWLEREKTPYFGTLFIHVGVIFQSKLPAHVIVIAEPYIAIRYGNAMWRAREFEIWMFKWPNLIWSFPGVSAASKMAVCPAEPWRSPSTLLLYRAKGGYSLAEYRKWIKPRLGGSMRGSLAAMIACLPGFLVNGSAIFYGNLAARGAHTGLLDLRASRYYFRNWFESAR